MSKDRSAIAAHYDASRTRNFLKTAWNDIGSDIGQSFYVLWSRKASKDYFAKDVLVGKGSEDDFLEREVYLEMVMRRLMSAAKFPMIKNIHFDEKSENQVVHGWEQGVNFTLVDRQHMLQRIVAPPRFGYIFYKHSEVPDSEYFKIRDEWIDHTNEVLAKYRKLPIPTFPFKHASITR
jgi:hypothetical protein